MIDALEGGERSALASVFESGRGGINRLTEEQLDLAFAHREKTDFGFLRRNILNMIHANSQCTFPKSARAFDIRDHHRDMIDLFDFSHYLMLSF